MTAPAWFALPPEVHSTALSAGPGPGPLLASSAAWSALSVEYAEIAQELTAVVTAVETGVWQGPSAASYAGAHGPYLAWLAQQSAAGQAMAVEQQTAATAYSSALAAMPTMPELVANHVTHAALTATNFFGINTIPIAVNEADYARMWVQAATVMATYETTAGSAVASSPPAQPAPMVMKADTTAADTASEPAPAAASEPPDWFTRLQEMLYGLLGEQPGMPEQNVPLYDAIMGFFEKIGLGKVADPFVGFFEALMGSLQMLVLPEQNVPPYDANMGLFNQIGLGIVANQFADFFEALMGPLQLLGLQLHSEWLWATGNPFSYLQPGFFAYIMSVPQDPGSYIAF